MPILELLPVCIPFSYLSHKPFLKLLYCPVRERMPTSIQPARQVAGMRIRSPPGSPRKKRRQGVPVIETLQNIIEEEEEEEVVVNENQDPVKQVAAPPRKGRERGMTGNCHFLFYFTIPTNDIV